MKIGDETSAREAGDRLKAAAHHRTVLELRLAFARLMSARSSGRSNRAWLLSAVEGAAGTLLAVSSIREAERWRDEVTRLEEAVRDAAITVALISSR